MTETDPASEMMFKKWQGGGQRPQNNIHVCCHTIVRKI
jgi:hypothetical protein